MTQQEYDSIYYGKLLYDAIEHHDADALKSLQHTVGKILMEPDKLDATSYSRLTNMALNLEHIKRWEHSK